MLHKYFSNYLK